MEKRNFVTSYRTPRESLAKEASFDDAIESLDYDDEDEASDRDHFESKKDED